MNESIQSYKTDIIDDVCNSGTRYSYKDQQSGKYTDLVNNLYRICTVIKFISEFSDNKINIFTTNNRIYTNAYYSVIDKSHHLQTLLLRASQQ